jgi:hypothetical protein
MENTFHSGCSKKSPPETHLPLKQAVQLVQGSIAVVYIVKAMLAQA